MVTGLAWLSILLGVALIDTVLALTKRPTLTQWARAQDRRFPWFRWVVLGALGFLVYHLFWQ